MKKAAQAAFFISGSLARSRSAQSPETKVKLNTLDARLHRPPAPCFGTGNPKPSAGIPLRSGGKPLHIVGNARPDAVHIPRRMHRRFLRRRCRSLPQTRCPAPCKQLPCGISARSPYRAGCSAPSFASPVRSGMRLHNGRMPRRMRNIHRYRIDIVHEP